MYQGTATDLVDAFDEVKHYMVCSYSVDRNEHKKSRDRNRVISKNLVKRPP